MAGQSAGRSIGSVMSDIKAVSTYSSTMDGEGSKIGGEGRNGNLPAMAPKRDITSRYSIGSGNATRGETGYNSGSGKS